MATYRIKQAAELLGVSDDTVRRWADSGRLQTRTEGSRQVVEGEQLARLAQEIATTTEHAEPGPIVSASARNRCDENRRGFDNNALYYIGSP